MKKEDVDFIFRKHHLKFSLKLAIFVTLIVAMGLYYDASYGVISLGIVGVIMPLILILFKDVITELLSSDEEI